MLILRGFPVVRFDCGNRALQRNGEVGKTSMSNLLFDIESDSLQNNCPNLLIIEAFLGQNDTDYSA